MPLSSTTIPPAVCLGQKLLHDFAAIIAVTSRPKYISLDFNFRRQSRYGSIIQHPAYGFRFRVPTAWWLAGKVHKLTAKLDTIKTVIFSVCFQKHHVTNTTFTMLIARCRFREMVRSFERVDDDLVDLLPEPRENVPMNNIYDYLKNFESTTNEHGLTLADDESSEDFHKCKLNAHVSASKRNGRFQQVGFPLLNTSHTYAHTQRTRVTTLYKLPHLDLDRFDVGFYTLSDLIHSFGRIGHAKSVVDHKTARLEVVFLVLWVGVSHREPITLSHMFRLPYGCVQMTLRNRMGMKFLLVYVVIGTYRRRSERLSDVAFNFSRQKEFPRLEPLVIRPSSFGAV
ncbi:hypothetical protein PsorP6_002153 [Peronosclerospora sorghi]|uniref:Uncharacterized protein n=1 Tax=Peronosclerospora sorghi TaxID=230839 RepID=A0ACC0WVQ1_9STRA|nr:hypothetical protein PsorP6_002153 [Peronosclerospora sorghi]